MSFMFSTTSDISSKIKRSSFVHSTALSLLFLASGGCGDSTGGAASSAEALDEDAGSSEFAFGTGSVGDPFGIDTCARLQAIKDHVTSHFVLASDIECAGFSPTNDGKGFFPIGTNAEPFTGTLDGGGHVVRNLLIARPNEDEVGLFRRVDGATFRDFGLEDANVTGDSVVGVLIGTTDDTDSEGPFPPSVYLTIDRVFITGSVSAEAMVGALGGHVFYAHVHDVYSQTDVAATSGSADGLLVGHAYGSTYEHVYVSGELIGDSPYVDFFSMDEGTTPMAVLIEGVFMDNPRCSGSSSEYNFPCKTTDELKIIETYLADLTENPPWDFNATWGFRSPGPSYPCLRWEASCVAPGAPLPQRPAVLNAMRRVNENWIVNHVATGDRGWARATYYEGNMGLYGAYPDPMYLNYTLKWATGHNWTLYQGPTTRNADNQCIGQTYVDLYRLNPVPVRIAMIETNIDNMLATSVVNDWWWVDALHMAMPVFARLAVLNDDDAYTNRMYAMYDHTKRIEGGGLYNTTDHLWWRDATFVSQHAPNGQNVYWARGNGWAFAAHARVIEELDKRATLDPHRAEYVQTFQDMAAAIVALQQPSGFWAPNMLDPASPAGPETSGTAFFTYGLAWGVNHGLLDGPTYRPYIAKAWNAMVSIAIDAKGKLGFIQPVGIGPSATSTANDNYDFGVGAFLLAGSQVLTLAPGVTPDLVSQYNYALGSVATATAQQVGNEAAGAIDNDLTTRWSAEVYPQALTLDLGVQRNISSAEIVALEQRAYRFRIDVSNDNATWTTVVNDANNTESAAFMVRAFSTPAYARYVRLTVLGIVGSTTPWTSIVELRVMN